MPRFLTLALAAGALWATGASAGPLSNSSVVSSSGKTASSEEKRGALSYVTEQLSISLASAARTVGYSSGGGSDKSTHYSKDQCNEHESTNEDEAESTSAKKKEPVGPEPIYFGF